MSVDNPQDSTQPVDQSRDRTPEHSRIALLWILAPFAFAACTVAMIFSLPFFPSHDGPVHLYYVDVLRGLLSHSGPYPQFFEIKSYLTPYMVEYFSLVGLERLFSPWMSEKILICAYALTFIFGFWFLLRSITRESVPWTLTGALFCINLYIYMGFVNYALGMALSLFLIGFWMRWMKDLTLLRIGILFAGFLLLAFTHPVPLAAFLAFACLYTCAMVLQDTSGRHRTLRTSLRELGRPIAVLAVMGIAFCLWILRFIGHIPKPHKVPDVPRSIFIRFSTEILLHRLESPYVYKLACAVFVALVAITAAGVVSAVWSKRAKIDVLSLLPILFAVFFFTLSFTVPEFLIGGSYLGERFSIYWVVFLFAGAAAINPPRWCTSAVGIVALTGAMVVVYSQWHYLSSTARDLDNALNVPLVKSGSLGAIVTESSRLEFIDPYTWAAATYFRESQAILTNAPWTDLKFIMLRPKRIEPWTFEDQSQFALDEILDTLNKQGTVQLDFFVRYGASGPQTAELAERLRFQMVSNTPRMGVYLRADAARAGVGWSEKMPVKTPRP
ncbi:MAG: hypothetical protein ABSB50_16420 [Terracidiphilus sp.]|jgi:hypothetical protein